MLQQVVNMWRWHPPVGVWIGILGLLGVIVPLIRDLQNRRPERAVWTFVMFALLLLEIKSVYQDRNEHDEQQAKARALETESFKEIADGINGAIQQSDQHFQATMGSTDALITSTATTAGMSRQTLDRLIGVGSHIVVTPNLFPIDGKNTFTLMLSIVGKNPMWDLNVSIQEKHRIDPAAANSDLVDTLAGKGRYQLIYEAPSNSPGYALVLSDQTIKPDPGGGTTTYYIKTLARNANTIETLNVRFNHDLNRWQFSCSLTKDVDEKPVKLAACKGNWVTQTLYVSEPPS